MGVAGSFERRVEPPAAQAKGTVYETEVGRRPLSKVGTNQILAWRDSLPLAKPSANRTLTALKAALNLAVRRRRASAIAAREWGDVKPFRAAGKRRDLFLDLKQRRSALLLIELGDHVGPESISVAP